MNVDSAHLLLTDNQAAGRFEANYGGEVLGYITYQIRDGVMQLPHTFVKPAARGQNVAALLTEHALQSARAQGLRVLPICWYVDRYIRRNPQYRDLLNYPEPDD
ncbi:MAG TPA: GNAT family N-acetyltransferase [Anaerolineae bacterium]|nr:GNAT family N-acetyltransferase [Anaerolineae bacterium]